MKRTTVQRNTTHGRAWKKGNDAFSLLCECLPSRLEYSANHAYVLKLIRERFGKSTDAVIPQLSSRLFISSQFRPSIQWLIANVLAVQIDAKLVFASFSLL